MPRWSLKPLPPNGLTVATVSLFPEICTAIELGHSSVADPRLKVPATMSFERFTLETAGG